MAQLFHRDLGGTGKPALVVLHGLLGSSRNWQSTGGDLAARYQVWALDLRNHGRSPHEAEMSYEAMVADVIAWMDGQGIAKASLMGHSMGGKVAMLLACRHSERVERLVVVDIAPKDYNSAAHRSEFAAMNELDLRPLQSRGEAEMKFEARVGDWAMRKFLTTNLERDAESGAWRWLVNLPVLTAALPALEKTPLADGDRFAGPVLFVTGGKSRYVVPTDWEGIERHFPQSALEVIAESGHNPHMETREAFVRAVLG
ncbi:alpha/beta hydrolase [Nibricoccus aquaticus]|uniref:Alpha/beta hydrolase n=1 Tax=Nibricoccus aquaticus TaxID=2576891 RepID=A0A290QHK5_9BACT|nr:alpha/beta fold hydrolase [Nibricoccus aquaticus]ATC65786.1 alpha/beta hydrolase [Nibricoccus aquaticus]